MSEEKQTGSEVEGSIKAQKRGLWTRQPLSSIGKVAFWASFVGLVGGLGGTIALTIVNGTPSRDIVTTTIVSLIVTICVVSGLRWLQVTGILFATYNLYLIFNEPFVVDSLARPKTDPNGGFGHFVGDVFVIAIALLAFVALVGTVLQNYRRVGRKMPRWFAPASSAITGMAIGALLIGALSPSTTIAALQAPQTPTGPGVPVAVNMGMAGAPISVPQLQAPVTGAHVDKFTLTAQAAQITPAPGTTLAAWTFNGTAPGPTLHVRQGDEVVVTLVNRLSFGVTIHWHGVRVTNAADGVAGVTQDAVKPGQSYVYRFIALDAGTYWYHSHQFSYEETSNGLYGMLIVDPALPTLHADVDDSVALHTWNGPDNQVLYTMNASSGTLNQAAKPGQWVRLRIVNTAETPSGNPPLVTLVGAPFQVVALDGQDLHGPQWLNETPLPIGAAQRYDIYFQMPARGSVALVTSNDSQSYAPAPALAIGQGSVPARLPAVSKWFDFTTYGTAAPDDITPKSHFDATFAITLENQMGTSLGRMGMTYTMNGKVFPDTSMLMVKEGQLVKIHFDNQTNLYHPMHLHGHVFTVLAQNGEALTGSPVHLDTVLVPPHATYDVAFNANNPGIWMIHCHNFLHANWGMDMMLTYDVSSPYTVGTASGNFPD